MHYKFYNAHACQMFRSLPSLTFVSRVNILYSEKQKSHRSLS